MNFAKILGTGSCAPENILSNEDLEKIVETSDEWITTRTGIKQRRIADKGIYTSDMAYEASLKALENADIDASELDGIILGTISPDFIFPSTACILQSKLGCKNIMAFDLLAGCSGFLYALHVGQSMVSSGQAKKLLIVGAEVLSRIMDYEDRTTCILFGDGAGAVVLSESDEPGILSSCLNSDGDNWELLYMPGGGSRIPATVESVKNRDHFLKMNGRDVYKVAVKSLETASIEAVEKANLSPGDIDLFVPHQANLRIIDAVRKRLDMPEDKVYVNLDKYGNTSSASVPIALDEAIQAGRAKKGDNILTAAFGAGFTWGATLFRL
ncbi:MAG: beta-ketoacyl-ACP synthase III [Thermodesulfobacteriota bacterium]